MSTIYHSSSLRKGRSSVAGQTYHLRFSLKQPHQLFRDFTIARTVVRAIARKELAGRARNLCFCVMPDHVHWLMVLQQGSVGQSVQNIKRLSSYQHQTTIPWQRGFFDRAIREVEDTRKIARYIVANPLRAGLVKSLGDYPHWDAIWLESSLEEMS